MFDMLLSGYTPIFSLPALVGTLVFGIRALSMLMGGDGEVDASANDAGDVDVSGDGSDFAFEVVSIQSIAAFMMGAGWGGLGALKGSGLSLPVSVAIAVVCGIGMVWLLYWILRGIHELRSNGNISLSDAVGRQAQVYVTVPPAGQGRGQIQVVVKDRLRTMPAVSNGPEMPRNVRVRVIRANADNTVVVERDGAHYSEGE